MTHKTKQEQDECNPENTRKDEAESKNNGTKSSKVAH